MSDRHLWSNNYMMVQWTDQEETPDSLAEMKEEKRTKTTKEIGCKRLRRGCIDQLLRAGTEYSCILMCVDDRAMLFEFDSWYRNDRRSLAFIEAVEGPAPILFVTARER
jgi:hypothetical protein